MKFIEVLLQIFGWLQIVACITLAAGLLAFVVFLKWSNPTGETISIIIISIGFILGAIWATRIWQKHGTIAWLSRIRKTS